VLADAARSGLDVKDICFSGNGEPTLSPHLGSSLELAPASGPSWLRPPPSWSSPTAPPSPILKSRPPSAARRPPGPRAASTWTFG
jgi:hypothetical protein